MNIDKMLDDIQTAYVDDNRPGLVYLEFNNILSARRVMAEFQDLADRDPKDFSTFGVFGGKLRDGIANNKGPVISDNFATSFNLTQGTVIKMEASTFRAIESYSPQHQGAFYGAGGRPDIEFISTSKVNSMKP